MKKVIFLLMFCLMFLDLHGQQEQKTVSSNTSVGKLTPKAKEELEIADRYCSNAAKIEFDPYPFEVYIKYSAILNARQQYNLAALYAEKSRFSHEGSGKEGRKYNEVNAILYYEKAAQAGVSEAMKELADYYYVKEDRNKTIFWYEKWANKGNTEAMLKLASVYEDTKLGASEINKAIYWLEKAANAKNDEALYKLGTIYYEGKGGTKDYLKAKNYFEAYISKKSDQDKSEQLYFNLGWIYSTLHDDTHVPKDNKKAIDYFNKIFKDDTIRAQAVKNMIMIYYKGGAGVEKDEVKAELYFDELMARNQDLGFEIAKFLEEDNQDPRLWYVGIIEQCNRSIIDEEGEVLEEVIEHWKESIEKAERELAAFYDKLLSKADKAYQQGDYATAKALYEDAVKKGSDEAKMHLADLYYEGKLGDPDYARAFELYEEPTDNYYSKATLRKADMLYNGKGISKNQYLAIEMYTDLAKLGDTESMVIVADHYYQGNVVAKDIKKAFRWYKQASEKGNTKAMLGYGKILLNYQQNKTDAAVFLEKAANAGYTEAMALYGLICEGLLKTEQAQQWYEKAAEANEPVALRQLGRMYFLGGILPKNQEKAFSLYQKAAQANDAEAMNYLAEMYLEGIATPKNLQEAFSWYEKAAKADVPMAMYSLADLYRKGKGVNKDREKAHYWVLRACQWGLPMACNDKMIKEDLKKMSVSPNTANKWQDLNDYSFSFSFDDNRLDRSFWIVPNTQNNRRAVQVQDGMLKMEQTVTDDHDIHIKTRKIAFDSQIIIEREVLLHKGGENYTPRTEITFDNGSKILIMYRNDQYSYKYGIYLFYVANDKTLDEVNMCPLILNEWFKEKIVINRNGNISYYIDDKLIKEDTIKCAIKETMTYSLLFDTYGWYTGHRHYFDNFKIINY